MKSKGPIYYREVGRLIPEKLRVDEEERPGARSLSGGASTRIKEGLG